MRLYINAKHKVKYYKEHFLKVLMLQFVLYIFL